MSQLWRSYIQLLKKHPAKTQIIQTGLLMSAGDIISQTVVEGQSLKTIDWNRNMKFSAFGFCIAGPAVRVWYNTLDKIAGPVGTAAALKKMSMDQLLFAPTFLVIFLGYMGVTQGGKEAAAEKIKKDYWNVLVANWKVWPAFQLANFYFVPLQLRILFVQVVALFWNTYLAFVSNQK